MRVATNHFVADDFTGSEADQRKLHRIQEVRYEQGVSLRAAARRMRMAATKVHALENENADMSLTMLYRWQQALGVPAGDLLVEDENPLSSPVMQRAQMVRLMKTAATAVEKADDQGTKKLARNFVNQLVELMPELEGVGAWETATHRSVSHAFGRIAENPFPDDALSYSPALDAAH